MTSKAIPFAFVLLWSSGFIAAKAGLAHIEPFTFLLVRFGLAALLLGLIALLLRVPWPTDRGLLAHLIVAGALIHASYLGPNFWGASRGFPVGITALIGATQPILTALLAGRFLGERVGALQWTGLVVGFAGVVMVLADRIAFDRSLWVELIGVICGTVSLTVGTLYQKRFCARMNMFSGTVVQLATATALMLALALAFETLRIDAHPVAYVSIAWLVVLSVAIYMTMHLLFLRGAAARVASLFYLVPPITSTVLVMFFDEALGPLAIVGMAVAIVGVALATRK